LEKEFTKSSIPLLAQEELRLCYKGEPLRQIYKPDFICFNKIIIEIKAVKDLSDEHRAQVMNYLKATGNKLALLVNFGHYPDVEIERFIL
jgi:GxxExxY protein